MDVAERFAQLSSARRAKVGAIIVKDDRIISIGYNGMPSGWDNDCEDYIKDVSFHVHENDKDTYGTYVTKPEVLHAESNAIAKVAQSNESSIGATMFCTHMPCIECAKLIHQAGINTVYYRELKSAKGSGEEFLQKSKIEWRPPSNRTSTRIFKKFNRYSKSSRP